MVSSCHHQGTGTVWPHRQGVLWPRCSPLRPRGGGPLLCRAWGWYGGVIVTVWGCMAPWPSTHVFLCLRCIFLCLCHIFTCRGEVRYREKWRGRGHTCTVWPGHCRVFLCLCRIFACQGEVR